MFEKELTELFHHHLLRKEWNVLSAQGPRLTIEGRGEVVSLCSNNYLGLAEHSEVRKATIEAIERYGIGSGASRLISGTMELHLVLEELLAAFKETEAALVFNTGYAANTGLIPALAREGDAVLSDALNHASIIDGCRLSRAHTEIYRHRDMDHLESLLKAWRGRGQCLIVSDGVFSMDGTLAPLPDLVTLSERFDAVLMIDDAHGTGVLGNRGRGTAEHFGLSGRIPVQMGTLGKALGSFGAYVAGDKGLISYLRNTARSYIFSTSLPPALCAASMTSLNLVDKEAWRRKQLWKNRTRLVEGLSSLGISREPSNSPIIPVMIGDADRAARAADLLLQHGILAPAIRPPSVPPGTSRIRTTVTAAHTDADMELAISAFRILVQEGLLNGKCDG